MPRNKQFDQAEVLDRAMQTFWTHGFEATSVEVLVERTGINRGSLYASFGDKRSLFLAALDKYLDRRNSLLAELRTLASPRDAIRRVFESLFQRNGGPDASAGCLLVNTALELAAHDREIRDIVARSQSDMKAFFVERIIAGQRIEEFGASVDPERAGAVLLATLLGTRVLVRTRPDRHLLNAVIDTALDQLG